MGRRTPLAPTLIAAVALAAGACGGQGEIIDGWLVGGPFNCGPTVGTCIRLQDAAVSALNRRDIGHAGVVSVGLYEENTPSVRSGGPMAVAVFRLADGSRRAIGVRINGIPETLHWGPWR